MEPRVKFWILNWLIKILKRILPNAVRLSEVEVTPAESLCGTSTSLSLTKRTQNHQNQQFEQSSIFITFIARPTTTFLNLN